MSQPKIDEFHGKGGAYVVGADGARRQVESPTQDHPEGNAPRDHKGKLIKFPEPPKVEEAQPEPPPIPQETGTTSSNASRKGADK